MDIPSLTGIKVVNLVRSGRIRVQDIAEQLLDKIRKSKDINAFITLDPEFVITQAQLLDARWEAGERMSMHGLPLVVKDNIDTADLPTTCGTAALKDNHPARNARALQSLLDKGALLIGKTNLHELAGGVTGNNPTFGPVHNPYNRLMIAGGSSGGTAASIAAHQVPTGLGTDTGGSGRIPAALCGVCGFRPTTGRYSGEGVLTLTETRDTISLMARTVADIVFIDRGICRKPEGVESSPDAGYSIVDFRLGLPRVPFFEDLEAPIAEAMERVLHTLRSHGALLKEVDGFKEIMGLHEQCGDAIVMAEVRGGLEGYLRKNGIRATATDIIDQIATPSLKARLAELMEFDGSDNHAYRHLIDVVRPALQSAYAGFFAQHQVDAIIYPTTALTARPIGQDDEVQLNHRKISTFRAYSRNTDVGANAGLPSLTIPVGFLVEGIAGRTKCGRTSGTQTMSYFESAAQFKNCCR